MWVDDALETLEAYEADAMPAARLVAQRGSSSLLTEGEDDLAYSVSDERILEAIRSVVDHLGEAGATRRLWNRYPATCAFYMIDVGRREYESGALYPRIAAELCLDVEQYINRWADRFISFLDTIGLQRFTYASASKYKLESILLHGGLPDDAWQQVWQNWVLPGVRAGMVDPEDLIQWAISGGHDAPQLRTTTRDILSNAGAVVEGLTQQAVQAVIDAREQGFVDMDAGYRLPRAALESLEHVLGSPKLRWPAMRFDLESRVPVYFDVPELSFGRHGATDGTSAHYDVFEIGEASRRLGGDESNASSLSGAWKMEAFKIPVPAARGFEMLVRLREVGVARVGREKRIRWQVDPHGVWTFIRDRKGWWVCVPERSWRRPRKHVIYLVPPRYVLDAAEDGGDCRIVHEVPLDDDWAGWTAYEVIGQGGVRLLTLDGVDVEEWSVAQKCDIRLEQEEQAIVGELILDRCIPVYGLQLPDVVVERVDPMVELEPQRWSCTLSWRLAGEQRIVTVPFVLDEYRLRASLGEVVESLPDVVDDGEICVTGPDGYGSLRRRFVRVPFGRPALREVLFDEAGSLQGRYVIDSDVDMSQHVKNREVRISREMEEQVLTAPLSIPAIAACVPGDGKRVSMNIVLAGVSLESEGIDLPQGNQPIQVPEAALDRVSGAVLRVGASRSGGCRVELVLCAEEAAPDLLRTVGVDGRYTEALGFSEVARILPESGDATLALQINAGTVRFHQSLYEIPRGLGIGEARLDRSGALPAVVCDRLAGVDMEIRVLELTAPWRGAAAGVLRSGERSAPLGPDHFVFSQGRYGVWVQIADEWGDGVDVSTPPVATVDVTHEDRPDDPPPMGPYHSQLAQLLRHRLGIDDRPKLGRIQVVPRMHMLEADAYATLTTLLHALRPLGQGCAEFLAPDEPVASIGRDIMRLSEFRYPLSPALLRSLVAVASDGWEEREMLEAATAIRIPLIALRPSTLACFETDELSDAWKLDPYIGLLMSLMHSCAGGDPASEHHRLWLASQTGSADGDVLHELRLDTLTCRDVVEGRRMPSVPHSSITRAFLAWHSARTQKEHLKAAQWVRKHISAVREGLERFRGQSRPLDRLSTLVQLRDCGEMTKTISNVPLVTGALTLAVLAVLVEHRGAPAYVSAITGGSFDDLTHESLTEILMEALEICPEMLRLDLFLTRLWWSLETGELS